MSEIELLQSFTDNRSEEAFAALVRRYAGLVYSTARRRLASGSLAEDVTQLVFIQFATKPPAVKTHAELAAWLHRITVNVTIDQWRSESRRRARELQSVAMEPATPENTVWEEISPKLDEALNQLSDDERQVLLLRFFNRRTMREVGLALGVSEDAAKMRVSRAVDRLRTHLNVGAACTAATLAALLAERSAEAVPSALLARLSALKLPAVAGAGGFLAACLRVGLWKLGAGVAGLVLLATATVHFAQPRNAQSTAAANHSPAAAVQAAPNGAPGQTVSAPALRAAVPDSAPPTPVKLLFAVLDAESGKPLPGSSIHVACFGIGGQGESHELLTDAEGVAAIPRPDDPGKDQCMNVFVVADRHVPKVVAFRNDAPVEYTMKLGRAVTADGVVVDEHGQPVGGVKILVQGPGDIAGQQENMDFQTCPVFTGDDGSWSCSYLPRDYTNEVHLILAKTGYATTYPWVPVPKTGLHGLTLVIDSGFWLTGRVADEHGGPIAGARLKIVSGQPANRQSVETDAEGAFTFAGVAGETEMTHQAPLETNSAGSMVIRGLAGEGAAHVELAVVADGYVPQSQVVVLANPTNLLNLVLAPGKVFRGHVVDQSGRPIPNAVVQTDWDDHGLRRFDWGTRTDDRGQFEWKGAPEGSTLYWFEAEDYEWRRDVPLEADASDHQIVLHRAP